MIVIASVLAAATAVAAVGYWGYRRRVQEKCRQAEQACQKDTDRRRQDYYMNNFWTYDGSVQEEFEE